MGIMISCNVAPMRKSFFFGNRLSMREAVLIAGTESRHGAQYFTRARMLLAERGISVVESHAVQDKEELQRRVREAVRSGAKLVIVCAGDGGQTVVVGEFAHRRAVLGVIPSGTGNSFAQSLGIELELERAVDTIVNGKVASVDLGVVNGTYFANFATIGLDSEIAAQTSHRLKRIVGMAAYAVAGIGRVLTHKPFRTTIRWKKNKLKIKTHQMIIANGRYFGSQPLLPDASMTDGRLTFFACEAAGHLQLAELYVALARGTQTSLRTAHYFETRKLSIQTRRRQPIAVDGNAFGRTPARFRVAPRALRVMVPQSFPENV